MNYTIKNKKDVLVNFGTIKGNMLFLTANETKTIGQEQYDNFENVLLHYVAGGFISIEKTAPKTMAEKSITPETPKRKGRPKKTTLQEQVEAND